MESAGNDDGGLARRHVLRTPFSTSLECSKITFALNSARKQTTAIFAWIAPASRFLLPLPAWTSPSFLVLSHPFDIPARGDRSGLSEIAPSLSGNDSFARSLHFCAISALATQWLFRDLRKHIGWYWRIALYMCMRYNENSSAKIVESINYADYIL